MKSDHESWKTIYVFPVDNHMKLERIAHSRFISLINIVSAIRIFTKRAAYNTETWYCSQAVNQNIKRLK